MAAHELMLAEMGNDKGLHGARAVREVLLLAGLRPSPGGGFHSCELSRERAVQVRTFRLSTLALLDDRSSHALTRPACKLAAFGGRWQLLLDVIQMRVEHMRLSDDDVQVPCQNLHPLHPPTDVCG